MGQRVVKGGLGWTGFKVELIGKEEATKGIERFSFFKEQGNKG